MFSSTLSDDQDSHTAALLERVLKERPRHVAMLLQHLLGFCYEEWARAQGPESYVPPGATFRVLGGLVQALDSTRAQSKEQSIPDPVAVGMALHMDYPLLPEHDPFVVFLVDVLGCKWHEAWNQANDDQRAILMKCASVRRQLLSRQVGVGQTKERARM